MLQSVHQEEATLRASSLYCQWIRGNRKTGAPLVAVWIDRELRCFERHAEVNLDSGDALPVPSEEPGRAGWLPLWGWYAAAAITTFLS
jgi:hypothetical protein